jgi:hypothetical protein
MAPTAGAASTSNCAEKESSMKTFPSLPNELSPSIVLSFYFSPISVFHRFDLSLCRSKLVMLHALRAGEFRLLWDSSVCAASTL